MCRTRRKFVSSRLPPRPLIQSVTIFPARGRPVPIMRLSARRNRGHGTHTAYPRRRRLGRYPRAAREVPRQEGAPRLDRRWRPGDAPGPEDQRHRPRRPRHHDAGRGRPRRSAGCSARPPTSRSSCSPPWSRRPTASSASRSAPTTTSPSRSTRASCSPGSRRCSAAREACRRPATRPRTSRLRFDRWTLDTLRRELVGEDGVAVPLSHHRVPPAHRLPRPAAHGALARPAPRPHQRPLARAVRALDRQPGQPAPQEDRGRPEEPRRSSRRCGAAATCSPPKSRRPEREVSSSSASAASSIALLLAALVVAQAVSFIVLTDDRAGGGAGRQPGGPPREHGLDHARPRRRRRPLTATALAEAASTPRIRYWVSEESATPTRASFEPARAPGPPVPADVHRSFARRRASPSSTAATTMTPGNLRPPHRRGPRPSRQRSAARCSATPFDVLASVPFSDGGWLNAQTRIRAEPVPMPWPSLISSGLMAIAILRHRRAHRPPRDPPARRPRRPRRGLRPRRAVGAAARDRPARGAPAHRRLQPHAGAPRPLHRRPHPHARRDRPRPPHADHVAEDPHRAARRRGGARRR